MYTLPTIRFFKEEGCNKMKCPKCGQSMCYLCRYSCAVLLLLLMRKTYRVVFLTGPPLNLLSVGR